MLNLAIVIVNYNTKRLTLDCLSSIFSNKPKCTFEVWLVDNGSTDGSTERISGAYPEVKIIKNKTNLGFTKGNNIALKRIYKRAEYCLLLNSDTVVYPQALDSLLAFAKDKDFAIASCKLVSPDKSFQPNTGSLPGLLPTFFWLSGLDDFIKKFIPVPSYHQESKKFYTRDREVGWVSGSVMLIRSDVLTKIGFLNEDIFMYAEDVDFCWRAKKAGFKVGWTGSAKIMHIGGASSIQPRLKQWTGEFKGLFYLYRKNYGALAALLLKLFIYFFVFLRALAFLAIGKPEHAKTYAKVIANI